MSFKKLFNEYENAFTRKSAHNQPKSQLEKVYKIQFWSNWQISGQKVNGQSQRATSPGQLPRRLGQRHVSSVNATWAAT